MALHERKIESPPRHAEHRNPDQLLLDEELEKGDTPVHHDLQSEDVNGRQMVGDHEVPTVMRKVLKPPNIEAIGSPKAEYYSVEADPVLAHCHDPAGHEPTN